MSCPVLGIVTKDDEIASHQETGGVGDSLIRFHPYVEAQYEHDSNINYQQDGGQSDNLWVVRPGFSTVWSNHENTYLELAYQLEVEEFLRNTNLDTLNHRLDLRTDWNWNPFYVFFHEHYLNTNDRSYTTLTELIQRQDHQQTLTGGWSKNQLTLELQGDHFMRRFATQLTGLNYSTYGLSPSASWDWNDNERTLADVTWERYLYENDDTRTGQAFQSRVGWEYHVEDNLKTRLLAGYGKRQFDGSALADFSSYVGEWTFDDTRFYDKGHMHVGFQTSAQESIADAAAGFYRQHMFDASFAYDVTPKISPSLTASWARQIYGNAEIDPGFSGTRNDDETNAGIQLRYNVTSRFSIIPSYSFQHRASNVPFQSYTNHTASLTCRYEI